MRLFRLTLECSLCLAVLATAGCGRKSNDQVVGESPAQSPSPSGVSTPIQSQSSSQLPGRSEEHTSELQSHSDLVCRLLLLTSISTLSLHDALPIYGHSAR